MKLRFMIQYVQPVEGGEISVYGSAGLIYWLVDSKVLLPARVSPIFLHAYNVYCKYVLRIILHGH